MVEDLKEVAPCGMKICYALDLKTDFVIYTDINDRGKGRLSGKCKRCSWRSVCKPTEPDYLQILSNHLHREVKPLEVITQLFER